MRSSKTVPSRDRWPSARRRGNKTEKWKSSKSTTKSRVSFATAPPSSERRRSAWPPPGRTRRWDGFTGVWCSSWSRLKKEKRYERRWRRSRLSAPLEEEEEQQQEQQQQQKQQQHQLRDLPQ